MIIDYEGHRLLTDKEVIYLTPTQNEILNLLYENKNNVVKRKAIMERVYNLSDENLETILNKHMSLLNKKIGKYITIRNVKRVGYILEEKQTDFTFDSSQDILPF